MAQIKPASKAKLFCGIMYSDKKIYRRVVSELIKKFGEIEAESEAYDFASFTDHYFQEMGNKIMKRFVVFRKMIDRSRLAGIKLWTNSKEASFSKSRKRAVNLDPGYFTLHNLVLASAKDRSRRIYLGKGIYAELTLVFKKDGCITFDWTYADFKSDYVKKFFLQQRNALKEI